MNEPMADISRHVWETKYRYATSARSPTAGVGSPARSRASSRRSCRLGSPVFPHPAGLQVSAWRPDLSRRRNGAKRHTIQLLRDGPDRNSIPGIFQALQEGAVTMQQGGGIGLDFSSLRPRGTQAKSAGTVASGPVSFMQIWEAMCGTILSTGARRGAMMATLRCDHPDIEEFVTAKQRPGQLRRFNLSIQVTDAFMAAVRGDAEWPLVFPAAVCDGDGETVSREWPGEAGAVPCRVIRRVPARQLWDRILQATYDYSEPGVIFIDRINHLNNLWYRERITATNPCGEIPLPPTGPAISVR